MLYIAYCILRTAYCVLRTAYCVLRNWVLRTAYCVLRTAYCILHTAYCILHTAYCILQSGFCILHTVYCILYFHLNILLEIAPKPSKKVDSLKTNKTTVKIKFNFKKVKLFYFQTDLKILGINIFEGFLSKESIQI